MTFFWGEITYFVRQKSINYHILKSFLSTYTSEQCDLYSRKEGLLTAFFLLNRPPSIPLVSFGSSDILTQRIPLFSLSFKRGGSFPFISAPSRLSCSRICPKWPEIRFSCQRLVLLLSQRKQRLTLLGKPTSALVHFFGRINKENTFMRNL